MLLYFFSGCAGLTCNITNHEECIVSTSQGAKCVCKRGFSDVNGECRTKPIVISVIFRCTLPFDDNLSDLLDPFTLAFNILLRARLSVALFLNDFCDTIVVVNISEGSTVVTYDVLLPSNTTQNETTIRNHMENDIFNNATESLHPYFPVRADPNNTILAINSKYLTLSLKLLFHILYSIILVGHFLYWN